MAPRTRWAGLAAALLAAAACGPAGPPGAASTVGGPPVTIEFATQGLGEEGDATNRALAGFELANPDIHVNVLTLSAIADVAYEQLTQRLLTDGPTPDVLTLDVIWPATFASLGWLAQLDRFHPARSRFFQGEVDAGTYRGALYAIPWFINAEGVYYRTDLVPRAPTSPQELVEEAHAAMRADPAIQAGLAFEGARYEGAVTAFMDVAGGFGGGLDDLRHVDSEANVQALSFMRAAIATEHVSPASTTDWDESNVQQSYLAGQAAFAVSWPYLFSLAEAPSSPVEGRTAWIPFPAVAGPARAALGGYVLGINARSRHQDAAWKLIQYLLRDDVQIDRAVTAGDPPGVLSAYRSGSPLFDFAPYYRDEKRVLDVVRSRPVDPQYPQVSAILQAQINAALSGQVTPEAALARAQAQISAMPRGGR